MTSPPTFTGWRWEKILSTLFTGFALLFTPLAQSPAQPAKAAPDPERVPPYDSLFRRFRLGIAPLARWTFTTAEVDYSAIPQLRTVQSLGPTAATVGLALFAEAPLPVSPDLYFSARIGYTTAETELRSDTSLLELRPDPAHPDSTIPITMKGRVLTRTRSITLAPGLAWAPLPALRVGIAPTLTLQFDAAQSSDEVIVDPPGALFSATNSETRPVVGVQPVQYNTLVPGLDAWVGFAVPLSRNLAFHPSVRGTMQLLPGASATRWASIGFEGVLGISYSLTAPAPIPDTPVPAIQVPTPPPDTPRVVARKWQLYATLDAYGIDDKGNLYENPIIEIEESPWTVTVPMVPEMFLDSGSTEIPARYARPHSIQEARRFSIDSLTALSPLDVHRQLLNIVGARMRDNAAKRLHLQAGDVDAPGHESEREDRLRGVAGRVSRLLEMYLAASRPEDSPAGRITIEVDDLGAEDEAARRLGESKAWRDEHRGIVFLFEDENLAEPIVIRKTAAVASPPMVRFSPRIYADTAVAEWYVSVVQGEKELLRFEGESGLHQSKQWSLGDMRVNRDTTPVKYRLFVRDVLGQTFTTEGSFRVQERVRRRAEDPALMEVDEYYLVGFDYSSAELKPVHLAQIRKIAGLIADNAEISIIGYTDHLGDSTRNRQLSQDRARAVRGALQSAKSAAGQPMPARTAVQGRGPEQVPFDNNIPEGRIFSRMVHIIVRQAAGR